MEWLTGINEREGRERNRASREWSIVSLTLRVEKGNRKERE
jgi:hypothetical protein